MSVWRWTQSLPGWPASASRSWWPTARAGWTRCYGRCPSPEMAVNRRADQPRGPEPGACPSCWPQLGSSAEVRPNWGQAGRGSGSALRTVFKQKVWCTCLRTWDSPPSGASPLACPGRARALAIGDQRVRRGHEGDLEEGVHVLHVGIWLDLHRDRDTV